MCHYVSYMFFFSGKIHQPRLADILENVDYLVSNHRKIMFVFDRFFYVFDEDVCGVVVGRKGVCAAPLINALKIRQILEPHRIGDMGQKHFLKNIFFFHILILL